MLFKDSLKMPRQRSLVVDSDPTVTGDRGGMKMNNQDAGVTGNDTRMGQTLRVSELSYRRLFEAAKDGILILDVDTGLINDANPFLGELLGFSHDELVGASIWDLGPSEDIVANKAKFEQLRQQGWVRYENLPLEAKNGRLIAVEFVSNVYQAGDRNVIQCNVRDITKRRHADDALHASELSYRRLFEAAKDGILILEADTGRISDVNPFLIELLGFSHGELVGTPIWELGPFRDIVSNKAKFGQLQQQGYVRYENLPLETRDGRKVAVEFVSNVYLAGDHNVIQCNVRDITERKREEGQIRVLNAELEQKVVERQRLEAQFIEAQKMEVMGQLAGGVAHDFNNILAVIMCNSDLITSDLGPDSPLQKYTEEIRHASERAAGLTRQLLVFSRKQTVQPVVLDLNDVVKDLDKMLRRLMDENIEVTIVPGKEIGRVKADSGYVGQVLMNLVVNARDAMPNGGKLTLATNNVTLDENYARTHTGAIPGDCVMLSVSDTGTGMTDEVKAHLFEAFFTTKPKGKGTGLGLATCQTIVQQSGGHIGVYSEVGKGTTFKIYFPRVEQPLDVAARPIQTGPLPRGTETLLVVEDEPSVRHLTRGVLETQGYEVLSASNGQDALHVAREHKGSPIRLVVTDVIMPLMGGEVMAEWLKTTYPGLKILFTSGYTDDAITHHGVLDAGVEFLPKPYTPATLARKVREVLDQPSAPKPDTAQTIFGVRTTTVG
jgi:two-component system cell cycle sensor histidine kinase/response regulator CckA